VVSQPPYYTRYQRALSIYVIYPYAYLGCDGYFVVFDISNPSNPTEVTRIRTNGFVEDIYVSGSYAYLANGLGGLLVIDVSDPTAPTIVGRNSSAYLMRIAIAGNYGYAIGGLVIIDVSNPFEPIIVSSYDVRGAKDIFVDGGIAYLAASYNGLRIIDVHNPALPREIGSYGTSGWATSIFVQKSPSVADNDDFDYAHLIPEPPANGWPTQILDTDTNSATVAPDDPDMGCGAGVNSHTLWFKLIPSYYGRVRVRTYSTLDPGASSNYDTVVAVFTGQRGALSRIACNDDASGHEPLSDLTFEAEAGKTYYIEVASYDNTPGGVLSLFVNYEVSPKAWTLMFYFAANNDLEGALKAERDSLVRAAKNLNVNIVALWDDNLNLFGSKYLVFTP
ncbi:MAG: hypothetical protein H5T63_11820, partial [Chloroflexi bacterium]|nr:hypothetical protein [Chloroflexota bacterium]